MFDLRHISFRSMETKQILAYLFWGVVTTIVGFGVYYVFVSIFSTYYLAANVISWLSAVLVAFVSNKVFVFKKHEYSSNKLAREFLTFVCTRISTGILDMLLLFLLVSFLGINELISKIVVSVMVVILNYVFGKWVVFR